jgi:hypothetical protein
MYLQESGRGLDPADVTGKGTNRGVSWTRRWTLGLSKIRGLYFWLAGDPVGYKGGLLRGVSLSYPAQWRQSGVPNCCCVSTWPPVVLRLQSVLLYVASQFYRLHCVANLVHAFVLVAGVARPGHFIPEETTYCNHCTEGWLGLGFGLNVLRKRTPDVPAGHRSTFLRVNSQCCSVQQ